MIEYPFIDCSVTEEISPAEFEDIRQQKKISVNALAFEENMHSVLGNYADYLGAISKVRKELVSSQSNRFIHKSIIEINRKINNLLSSTYSYVEHGHERVSIISKGILNFKDAKNAMLHDDMHLEFLQHLRNYSQHYAFVVHRWFLGDISDPEVIPFVNLEYMLESDNKKREKFLNKMLEQGECEIDLNCLLKKQINFIWELHVQIRSQVNSNISRSHEVLKNTMSKIEVKAGKKCKVVKLTQYSADNVHFQQFVTLELIDRYDELIAENYDLYREATLTN